MNNSINSSLSNISQAGSYTDFTALAELRAKVNDTSSEERSAEATREVARQFESLFLQMMLKSMRDATYVDENSGSDQTRFYQEMFDKQIALDLSNRENGGIGLASIMEQQMSGGVQQRVEENAKPHTLLPIEGVLNKLKTTITPPATNKVDSTSEIPSASTVSVSKTDKPEREQWSVDSPEAFTQMLWPHANKAAERLGVKPEVLIAQAALETGWGEKMIKDAYGNNANNLFGIKADYRWQGESVSVSTLEYRNGIAAKEQASFRAYTSLAESFDDYANFLQSSPRYQNALEHAAQPDQFLEKLQQAGYSTDPVYAQKIQSITQRDSFMQTVNELKADNSFGDRITAYTNLRGAR